jgi:hypothetical protein
LRSRLCFGLLSLARPLSTLIRGQGAYGVEQRGQLRHLLVGEVVDAGVKLVAGGHVQQYRLRC